MAADKKRAQGISLISRPPTPSYSLLQLKVHVDPMSVVVMTDSDKAIAIG